MGLGQISCGYDAALLFVLDQLRCRCAALVRQLRAGELDLWFEDGRLCWLNHGEAIAFWPRLEPASGNSHAPLAADPELHRTGLEHYQFEVMEALHRPVLRYCLLKLLLQQVLNSEVTYQENMPNH